MHGWYGLDVNEGPCTEQTFHLTAENPYAEYDEIRSFTHRYDNCASSSKDGKYAFNYYWNTPSDKKYVWLTDKSSTFYFYTGSAYDHYTTRNMGYIPKGASTTTRALSALKAIDSRHFATGDVNWDGVYVSGGGCPRGYYSFDVTPTED